MKDFFSRHRDPVLFTLAGKDDDVVVASRIRLSRNISSMVFPPLLSDEGLREVRSRIDEALREAGLLSRFTRYDFEELSEVEAEYLREEGRGRTENSRKVISLYFGDAGSPSLMINDKDHLRIMAERGGLSLDESWASADEIDTILENTLDYATSIEWGYLSTDLGDLGPGLQASVLLHLPGISLSNQFEKIGEAVESSGHEIHPFFTSPSGEKEADILGDLFSLSGGRKTGGSEKEILEKLEEITGSLLNYEREMRNLLFEKKREFLEDQMFRAFGILERAKFLNFEEGIKLLSLVRMGCFMGCLSHIDSSVVTSLMFQSGPAHVRMGLGRKKRDADEEVENRERAALIGGSLKKTSRGGDSV
jgi:protein arginine kinase